MSVTSEAAVNFTGGLQAVDNSPSGATDVSLATTIPNAHTFTGNLSGTSGANFNFAGSTGTFDTSTGNVTLNGNTSLATGKTFTAGLGATSGTGGSSAVNVQVASGLTTGSLLNVDTGTSAFTGNAVNMTSSGTFTGTLLQLTADSTTAGTVLGIHTNALKTGAVINADLGSSIYTGSAGALRLIANSASTGTLLAISGTTLAANGGIAAQITLGTPGGVAEPAEGKALRVALGTQGDAVYANAASGFTGSFERYQVAGVDVLNVTATGITTTLGITQTGAVGITTGTGPILLNGATTFASGIGATSAGGTANFNFSASNGTFDTTTGAVTLRGNTATASGVTLVAGSGISNGTNAVTITTGVLTTGSALKIDVGTSTAGASGTQGIGLDVSGTGAFAGAGNLASLVRISNTGTFTGTLETLSAQSTTAGTVLGISAPSLLTGKAIDVQLTAAYTGGGTNQGAVNVRGGAFSGNLFSVSAGSDAQTAGASLANFAAPLTIGHLLNLSVTGTYVGTGVLSVDLTGAGTASTGPGILVNAVTGYTGRFIDLQVAGSSKFSVTPTQITTSANFAQTGAAAFTSGTGAVVLNGATTVAANFAQTGANSFSTGTGAVAINGTTSFASGVSVSSLGGAANFDWSTSTGTFQTGTGNISLNGNVITGISQSGGVGITTGTGAIALNGNTTLAVGKGLLVGTATTTGNSIKVVEFGTCTANNVAQQTCSATLGATTGGITWANLTTTDVIVIAGQGAIAASRGCVADAITAGTSFRIECSGTTGGALVFNVMVVRH